MIKNIFILFFFFGGVLSFCQAQSAKTITAEVKENIKSRVNNGVNAGIVVGIINGDGTHFHSYGVKSLKNGESVDEYSVFEIGSITKTFTGILLADMVMKRTSKFRRPFAKIFTERYYCSYAKWKVYQIGGYVESHFVIT